MGVYIPNMEKPISCDDCIVPLSKCDYLQKRADECPLIEIELIRCGECMRHKNHNGRCTIWDRTTKRNFYCKYGERRAE